MKIILKEVKFHSLKKKKGDFLFCYYFFTTFAPRLVKQFNYKNYVRNFRFIRRFRVNERN